MKRVRRNDTVRVISGKDAGKEGRVVRVYPKTGRVMVEGVNRVTKHTPVRANARGAKTGGIEHKEAKVDASNVMVVVDGQATRVGYRRDEETGRNVRVARRTGKDL